MFLKNLLVQPCNQKWEKQTDDPKSLIDYGSQLNILFFGTLMKTKKKINILSPNGHKKPESQDVYCWYPSCHLRAFSVDFLIQRYL